jgi:short-subunit dehydrogenase
MDLTDEEILRNFNVNLLGLHRVTKAFFPLISQSKGRIINISSILGFLGTPLNGSYCTAKFAVEGYSDVLRRELMQLGIKVIVIEPGLIKTKIWDKGESDLDVLKEKLKGSPFYHTAMKVGKDFVNSGKKWGIDPIKIAEKINLAFTLPEPKTRYRVTENNFAYKMVKLLSDKTLDKQFGWK